MLPPVGSDKSSYLIDSASSFKISLLPTVEKPSILLKISANSGETLKESPIISSEKSVGSSFPSPPEHENNIVDRDIRRRFLLI